MRHLRSILYALVLAPAVWILCGVGFDQDLTGRARDNGGIESLSGVLLLLLAGTAYAILLFSPISPAGPAAAGLVFLGVGAWARLAPDSYAGLWPASVTKEGFDVSTPGYGLAVLLAVPLMCTALSAKRWAAYEPPQILLIGTLGKVRGAAQVAGPRMAAEQTTVIALSGDATQVIGQQTGRPPAPPGGAVSGSGSGADDGDEKTTVLRLGSSAGADTGESTTVIPPVEAAPSGEPATVMSPVETAPSGEPTTAMSPIETAPSGEPTTAMSPIETAPSDEPTTAMSPIETAPSDEPTTAVSLGKAAERRPEAADEPTGPMAVEDKPTESISVEQPTESLSPEDEATRDVAASEEPTRDVGASDEVTRDVVAAEEVTRETSSAREVSAAAEAPTRDVGGGAAQTDKSVSADEPTREVGVGVKAAKADEDGERPAPPDGGEKTQALRLPTPEEVTRHLGGAAPPFPLGHGEETQVIGVMPQAGPGELTQVIRTGTVEPPGDRTQVLTFPVPGEAATVPTRPGETTKPMSIVGEERPDPGEDPTTRLTPPPAKPDAAPATDPGEATTRRRAMTVTNLERPADEAEDDTRPLNLPKPDAS